MADTTLINKALRAGFPIGSTDFNKFVASGGRAKGFPLTRPSGYGIGETFIGGNPINRMGTDRFGRLTPGAQAVQQLAAQSGAEDEFKPELLEVTKSEPIQEAVAEALQRSREDSASRRTSFEDFNKTVQKLRTQSQADIDRDAQETFNTDRLRDFLAAENRRYESGSQALANRATQFLRRRLDEGLLAGAGAGAPIADSSDLRNRTMQAFLDINLPLQQQLSDRRIAQEMALKNMDIGLAGRSQAARAALLQQLALPLQLGAEMQQADLLNLARIQAIEDANAIRGVKGNIPLDFEGLNSYQLGAIQPTFERLSAPSLGFNLGGVRAQPQVTPAGLQRLMNGGRGVVFDASGNLLGGTGMLPTSVSAGIGAAQRSRMGLPSRRIATPQETSRMRRASRLIAPFANPLGASNSAVTGPSGYVGSSGNQALRYGRYDPTFE